MPGTSRQQVPPPMTGRDCRTHSAGCSFSVWVLFLILSSRSVVLASRPYLDHAASAQQQQHKTAQQIQWLTKQVASSVNSFSRQLKQSAFCPDGCAEGFCQQDSTSGALRCAKCASNLIVNREDGTCICPAGKYVVDGAATCLDCPKGSWCPGGKYSKTAPPPREVCPAAMTTLGLRSTSSRSCVNLPGYSYSMAAGTPVATICPVNTYGPGMKKQRACVPCPTGYVTNGVTGAKAPTACVVGPGYYLKGPGQVAPCPRGEWKAGIGSDGNCTRCALGVTTLDIAASSELNCTILVPGYYARSMNGVIVTSVAVCPQKYYCGGGTPVSAFDPRQPTWSSPSDNTIKPCPDGTWTENVGARSLAQCMTPPGYRTVSGATVPCGDNEFRADWKPPGEATNCTSCGVGVRMNKTDRLIMYDALTNSEVQIEVATSSDDCYIQPGQGLLFQSIEQTWRVVNCEDNSYGVSNISYGLSPQPCRMCPQGMITSKDKANYPRSSRWYQRNADGTAGFISPMACVTKAGWGYNGRNSYKCDKGTYNDKDTYSNCKPCTFGLTTAGLAAGVKQSDCGIAPGYGYEFTAFYNTTIVECPIGTYNDKLQYVRTTPCTPCPNGTTNTMPGSDSKDDCDKCLPGWGFADCARQCGGLGEAASYGPPGREYGSPCISCNNVLTSYSYNWMTNNDVWSAPVVARIGADNAVDCLAEFTQHNDGAYYLPVLDVPGNLLTPNVTTFSDCVALCKEGCSVVTYDYKTLECFTLTLRESSFKGDPFIAFKNFQAGSNGASSVDRNTTRAQKTDYGNYGWKRTPDALSVGEQKPAPNAATFTRYQQCTDACDIDRRCAAISVEQIVPNDPTVGYNNAGPKSCRLVYANVRPGTNKRSMIRVDTSSVAIPIYTRVCRDVPHDVVHGRWPTDCAGKPVGDSCVAFCDCNPDECYARDGCPVTICQDNGLWGPFNPPECTLAIPAQPQAVSCPTPIRSGYFSGLRKRSLLADQSPADQGPAGTFQQPYLSPEMRARVLAAHARNRNAVRAASTSNRNLLWAPPVREFSPVAAAGATVGGSSSTKVLCIDNTSPINDPSSPDYTGNYLVLNDAEYGQMVHDGGVCTLGKKKWHTGIAAQDFTVSEKRKWEFLPKTSYESYVWSLFEVPERPSASQMAGIMGMQLMIVGNVGTDHPCQATCGVTAIDVAFYMTELPGEVSEPLTDEVYSYDMFAPNTPGPIYSARVNLDASDPEKSFLWNQNTTGILNFDLWDRAQQVPNPELFYATERYYWVRMKLVVPFNGTDGSGLGRCYAYVALRDSPKHTRARWQEAGGYNTTCGPSGLDAAPVLDQTANNCTNGGFREASSREICSAAVTSNTCAERKYGPDTPRSCPFTGQDLIFDIYGFSDGGVIPGIGGSGRRRR